MKGWFIILIAAVMLTCQEEEGGSSAPPNIIFIMADDLGYGDVGAYGQFLKNEVQYLDTTAWHHGLGSYSTKRVDYSNDQFVEAALAFIEENSRRPFFLYLPFTIPHDNGEQVDSMRFEVPSQGIYAQKDWDKKAKAYAAMITRMDEGIWTDHGATDKARIGRKHPRVLYLRQRPHAKYADD